MRSKIRHPAARPDWLQEITPELVEFHVRRGKRLQAMALAAAARRGWSALAALGRRAGFDGAGRESLPEGRATRP
jgi:hypothetical protein